MKLITKNPMQLTWTNLTAYIPPPKNRFKFLSKLTEQEEKLNNARKVIIDNGNLKHQF